MFKKAILAVALALTFISPARAANDGPILNEFTENGKPVMYATELVGVKTYTATRYILKKGKVVAVTASFKMYEYKMSEGENLFFVYKLPVKDGRPFKVKHPNLQKGRDVLGFLGPVGGAVLFVLSFI